MKHSVYLVFLTLGCCVVSCAPRPTEADLVIWNSRLFVGDGTVVEKATVVVDDGRIVAVGENVANWQGLQEIDAAGRTVMPGLIDTHVHLLALVSETAESLLSHRQEQLPGILSDYLTQDVTTIHSTRTNTESRKIRISL